MLTMPMVLPVAIEIAFTPMLMIDRITVSFQAEDLPFNSPYATINEKIPIAINIQPSARIPAPTKEGETWERSASPDVMLCCCCSGGIDCTTNGIMVPAKARGGPIMSIIMPPIILRIAITITPVGREVEVVVNSDVTAQIDY